MLLHKQVNVTFMSNFKLKHLHVGIYLFNKSSWLTTFTVPHWVMLAELWKLSDHVSSELSVTTLVQKSMKKFSINSERRLLSFTQYSDLLEKLAKDNYFIKLIFNPIYLCWWIILSLIIIVILPGKLAVNFTRLF